MEWAEATDLLLTEVDPEEEVAAAASVADAEDAVVEAVATIAKHRNVFLYFLVGQETTQNCITTMYVLFFSIYLTHFLYH